MLQYVGRGCSTATNLRSREIGEAAEELRRQLDALVAQALREQRPDAGGADRSNLGGGVVACVWMAPITARLLEQLAHRPIEMARLLEREGWAPSSEAGTPRG